MPSVLIIGGTGAQGSAIARLLASTPNYHVKIQTRSLSSAAAQELAAIPNISLVIGSAESERDLVRAFHSIDAVYVNTNGFATGIKNETYIGIRIFELARREGVKHFIYAGLDYLGPLTNYDDKYNVGHYEGKGRVVSFIENQPKTPMAWTNILSGPYAEMLFETLGPKYDESKDLYVFPAPLHDGALPMIHLDDLAKYTLWALENPSDSNGLTFGAATEHVSWSHLVETFTKVTGKNAIYYDIPTDDWVRAAFGEKGQAKIGAGMSLDSDESLQTFEEDFKKWWELYRSAGASVGGDGQGIIKRDYKFLDRILPNRVKNIGQWMEKVGYDGTPRKLLSVPEGKKRLDT
jgi:uncharacterized protein YbjT (DUF2867 family)